MGGGNRDGLDPTRLRGEWAAVPPSVYGHWSAPAGRRPREDKQIGRVSSAGQQLSRGSESVFPGPPAIPGATVSTWRRDEWFRSVERVRVIGSEHDAFVMPGHGETGIQHAKGECLLREIEYLPNHVYE